MALDPKKMMEQMKEAKSTSYCITWYDEKGPNFLAGGDITTALGMTAHAQRLLLEHLANLKPLSYITTEDKRIIAPGGVA